MYNTNVKNDDTAIFQFGLFIYKYVLYMVLLVTSVYTLRSSIMIKDVKVIVTIFVNDSSKNITVANIIKHPYITNYTNNNTLT